MYSRRTFLATGVTTLAGVAGGRRLSATQSNAFLNVRSEPSVQIADDRVREMAMQALDAARRHGAVYSDVRLSYTRDRNYRTSLVGYSVNQKESLTVGIRSLVNGYWGFAAGGVWSAAEMERLAAESVQQAQVNALGKPRPMELAPVAPTPGGHWTMPIHQDPFDVHPIEVLDFLRSLILYTARSGGSVSEVRSLFHLHELALATSEGHYSTQRLYRSSGELKITKNLAGYSYISRPLPTLTPAGMGWELFRNPAIYQDIESCIEVLSRDIVMPVRPVDVGRYPIVLDAAGVASLASATIGAATEIDRVLGYEANATGTSYLRSPAEMLGTFQIGSPALNVVANRNESRGAATVQWDAEGVAPREYDLVRNGRLTDFLTMREGAGWLKETYGQHNMPCRSNGCAHTPVAMEAPLVHTPNLVITPAASPASEDDLFASMGDGVAFTAPKFNMDFQQSGGLAYGAAYRIKKGLPVERIGNSGILFRTLEIWKGVTALGGTASSRRFGMSVVKGEPEQTGYHSVTAVPVLIAEATVVNVKQKA